MIIVAKFVIKLIKVSAKDFKNSIKTGLKLNNEHDQTSLARNFLGWKSLKERRVEMKAGNKYKTINVLIPSRLCHLFQNVDRITDFSYLQQFLSQCQKQNT